MNSLNISVSCEVTQGCPGFQSSQGWVFEEEQRHGVLSGLMLLESSGKQTNSNPKAAQKRAFSPGRRLLHSHGDDTKCEHIQYTAQEPSPEWTLHQDQLRLQTYTAWGKSRCLWNLISCKILAFEINTKAARVKGHIQAAASLCNTTLVLRMLRRGLVKNNFWKIVELCWWCCTLLRAHYGDVTTTKFTDVFQQPGKRTQYLSPVLHPPGTSQSTEHRLRRRSYS